MGEPVAARLDLAECEGADTTVRHIVFDRDRVPARGERAIVQLDERGWSGRHVALKLTSMMLIQAAKLSDWIVALRRELHQHPELMYEEVKTSAVVRRTLDELGISYKSPMAVTGVVATLGDGKGPCVALRADMDALPIHEEADVAFRSKVDGKMHAC